MYLTILSLFEIQGSQLCDLNGILSTHHLHAAAGLSVLLGNDLLVSFHCGITIYIYIYSIYIFLVSAQHDSPLLCSAFTTLDLDLAQISSHFRGPSLQGGGTQHRWKLQLYYRPPELFSKCESHFLSETILLACVCKLMTTVMHMARPGGLWGFHIVHINSLACLYIS